MISRHTFVMDIFAIRPLGQSGHCQGREFEAEVREAGPWSAHWEFGLPPMSPRPQTPRAKDSEENKAGPPVTQ